MAVVVASAGTAVSATGRSCQRHVVYAPNSAVYWAFVLTSAATTELRAYYASDPDGTWTQSTSHTLTAAHDGDGRNLAVWCQDVSGTDVVHVGIAKRVTGGNTDGITWHVRATVTASSIAWGSQNQVDSHLFENFTPLSLGVCVSTDRPYLIYNHDGQDVGVNRANSVDAGSSWSYGWDAVDALQSGNFYERGDVLPVGSGDALCLWSNGAGTFTNVRWSRGTSGAFSAGADALASAITAQDDNDWGAVARTASDVHLVCRTGANTYVHRRYNGTSWSNGDAITTQASKAAGGTHLGTDGTSVWLAVIDSDAANTVRYCKWVSGTGWSAWSSFEGTTETRTALTGPGVVVGNLLVLGWSEVNGANFDVAVGALDVTPPTTEQEGFRWRNDDGSETTATWAAGQDANLTAPTATRRRLRIVANTTLDVTGFTPRLDYKLSTDSDWVAVPTADPSAPAWQASQTAASGQAGVTPTWPAHVAGDVALLVIESCGGEPAPLTTANGFVAVTNSPVSTGTLTNGTRLTVYWCRATSSSMAAPVVADPGNHVHAQIVTFRGCIATGDPWDVTATATDAAASTTRNFAAVTTTGPNRLVVLIGARDNDVAGASFSGWTNANLTGLAELTGADTGTALGNGGGHALAAGVKAAAGSTGTSTATVASSIGVSFTIALKPPAAPVTLSASANVAASAATATTAQLTPPAGKTTANFQAGRISDDTNPLPSFDPASGVYTENEYCLIATSAAANGSTYQFRESAGGTAYDSYPAVAEWTIGSGTSLVPQVGSGAAAGPNPSVTSGAISLLPQSDAATAGGVTLALAFGVTSLVPQVDAATGGGVDPAVLLGQTAVALVGTAAGAGVNPSVGVTEAVLPVPAGAGTGVGVNPGIFPTPALPELATGSGAAVGVNPTLTAGTVALAPQTDAATAAGVNPAVTTTVTVAPLVGSAAASGPAGTLTPGALALAPQVGSAPASGVNPGVGTGGALTPPVGTAAGGGTDPTITAPGPGGGSASSAFVSRVFTSRVFTLAG